jgi:hypothetical protein
MMLCGTGIVGLTIATDVVANPMPAKPGLETMKPLPPYLETLVQADTLDDPAVGFAGSKSKTYQAFEQAIAAGKQIRPELERLLRQGTPAGQLYAALLLLRLDRQAGEQALKQLRSDTVLVTRYSGCLRFTMTVNQAVTEILQGDTGLYRAIKPRQASIK